MGSVAKSSRSSEARRLAVPKSAPSRYAVCVDNDGYPASLERGKIYRVLPDADARARGYLRVVDESEEDYLYAAARFFPVALPAGLRRRLAKSV